MGPVISREGDRVRVQVKNKVTAGTEIEALTPGAPGIRFIAENMLSDAGEPIDVAAVPDTYFTLPAPDGIGEGDFLRARHEDEFHG